MKRDFLQQTFRILSWVLPVLYLVREVLMPVYGLFVYFTPEDFLLVLWRLGLCVLLWAMLELLQRIAGNLSREETAK